MKLTRSNPVRIHRLIALALGLVFATVATASGGQPEPWQLNMTEGVTATAARAYDMHMIILWICVVIGIVVFGAMAIAIFKFRKSKGAVPDKSFVHSTKLELLWTGIPILILIGMAVPATVKVIEAYDSTGHEMTVKIVGQQWLWTYEYQPGDLVKQRVRFTSRLDRQSDRIRQSGTSPTLEEHPHYLLEVDNRLLLPTNTKVRFVITADDVIHAWWVPALGWKQDAIPGMINEGWTEILEPGIYRGQCAELCGKDHGFMPIVVEAVPLEEFKTRIAAMNSSSNQTAATALAVSQQ